MTYSWMDPVEPREGYARVVKADAFAAIADRPFAAPRIGDIVRVTIIASAAQEDYTPDDEEDGT